MCGPIEEVRKHWWHRKSIFHLSPMPCLLVIIWRFIWNLFLKTRIVKELVSTSPQTLSSHFPLDTYRNWAEGCTNFYHNLIESFMLIDSNNKKNRWLHFICLCLFNFNFLVAQFFNKVLILQQTGENPASLPQIAETTKYRFN